MKVVFVTVRYGAAIVGGAEKACRQLAEHLAAVPGVEVEVHTTCATDAVTWADDTAPGLTVENRVHVHRHLSTRGRDPGFEAFSSRVLADPPRQTAADQRRWLELQGPVCPAAVDGAITAGADIIACTPYLFWPTVETARRATVPVVLHPAAHDEVPIRLPLFTDTFAAADGFAYYTDGERAFVEQLWPHLAARPQVVVGVGVEAETGGPDEFRELSGIGDRPYVLCLGRVDDGKGTRVLASFFTAYKRRRPGPLALVFAGPIVHPIEAHPDIVMTGPLSEPAKWSALAGTAVLVNPSAHESFSIVLLEAWAAGRPAIVNGRCAATMEHARRSHAALAFGGYASFEAALDRIVDDAAVATAMADAGREYVASHFAWPVVTERYLRFLEVVTHHRARAGVR